MTDRAILIIIFMMVLCFYGILEGYTLRLERLVDGTYFQVNMQDLFKEFYKNMYYNQ